MATKMLSPLFDGTDFLLDEGWDMSTFHREAATLTDMSEFWADVEAEAAGLAMVPPADMEDEQSINDWTIEEREPEEHKENIVHHDCMWTGYCGDLGHPSSLFLPDESIVASPGQSLLKRSTSPPRPETPPSLDEDEPPQFQHTVDVAGAALRLLRDSAAVAADHSYTLSKPASRSTSKHRYESLGVQTPTDSEEEIDVVSLGDKNVQHLVPRAENLPHVPSELDRHQIQHTVTSAITTRQVPIGRKRLTPPASIPSYSPPRKRTRGPGRRPRRSSPDTDSDADTPDLEKRSLHNDMERMRRIGLKNLFDQLKNQIPNTRDKERAPKVVILREAAALCNKLRYEDVERDQLRREHTKLSTKLRKLRAQVAARYHTP